MKPESSKREWIPPPHPRPVPRQSQPPLPQGPRPAAVQPQPKAMPTPEQIAAKAKAKAAARKSKLRESIARQIADESATMLERIMENVEAAEGDEEEMGNCSATSMLQVNEESSIFCLLSRI